MVEAKINHVLRVFELIISILVTATGVSLLFDDDYFFYPPNLKSFENDPRVDAVIILIGFAFFIYLIWFKRNSIATKVFLILCGAIFMALAFLQFWHASAMPMDNMASNMLHDAIINLGCFFFANTCAYFE